MANDASSKKKANKGSRLRAPNIRFDVADAKKANLI